MRDYTKYVAEVEYQEERVTLIQTMEEINTLLFEKRTFTMMTNILSNMMYLADYANTHTGFTFPEYLKVYFKSIKIDILNSELSNSMKVRLFNKCRLIQDILYDIETNEILAQFGETLNSLQEEYEEMEDCSNDETGI